MKAIRTLTKNHWILAIRKRLGISQEQMANHLQMGRSAYSMLESGRREITTPVLLHISQLEIKLAGMAQPVEKDAADKAAWPESWQRRFTALFNKEPAYRKRAENLRLRLGRMQGLYSKSRDWLDVIEISMKEHEDNPMMQHYWKKQQRPALLNLERCSLPAQKFLQLKIELLEAEARLYLDRKEGLRMEMPEVFGEKSKPACGRLGQKLK